MALDAKARPGFPRSGWARVVNAPEERERAFAPFCRVGGGKEIASGFGLSMVDGRWLRLFPFVREPRVLLARPLSSRVQVRG